MRGLARIATAGVAVVTSTAFVAVPATASPSHHPSVPAVASSTHHPGAGVLVERAVRHGHRPSHHHGGAVFVQTDHLAGNTVVAYHRSAHGTLTQAAVYPTGGLGGQLAGSVVDHTASQGSLAYDSAHHLLYAVNAGSNTITAFRVHGDRLTRLQVIGSGGTFPVSITFHHGTLYVLNARDGGSIQGFLRFGGFLLRVPSWHRNLGFPPKPVPKASEFVKTPGQVAFTPDGSKLVVTTKAGGNSIEVFRIGWFGRPSHRPVVTPDPGNVPFAVTFNGRHQVLVAEAGHNTVATYAVHRKGALSLLSRVATGQAATCWITSVGHKAYVSNAGSADVSGYRVGRRGRLTALGNTGTDPGTVDSAASSNGRFLYVQAGGPGTVDEFRIHRNGSLTMVGSVTVPGGVGGEGIVAS